MSQPIPDPSSSTGGVVSWEIREGDCLALLGGMESESVQTCVTSPPYWGLRDYGSEGQLGLESTPEQYVANLVAVFEEVKRVLRDDGTLWLNLGDSYAGSWGAQSRPSDDEILHEAAMREGAKLNLSGGQIAAHPKLGANTGSIPAGSGLKPKDLVGIPWLVAFALRDAGWWLRSDIVWAKPNPMPESVTDRPTRSHEYIFLLSKSQRYFYDADAVREEHTDSNGSRLAAQRAHGTTASGDRVAGATLGESPYAKQEKDRGLPGVGTTFAGWNPAGRNKRSVWTVTTQPYAAAHFATFPPKLIEPCILAGSAEGDTVLDPFAGAGTTGVVALRHNRSFIGLELNPDYCELARNRIRDDAPLFNAQSEAVA